MISVFKLVLQCYLLLFSSQDIQKTSKPYSLTLNPTTIEGKVKDTKTGEAIPFASIELYKQGVLITGTTTDIDGNYFIANVQAGTYDMEASYVGYAPQRQTGIIISAGKVNRVNFDISDDAILLDLGVEIKAYKVPIVKRDNSVQGNTITQNNIRTLPTKQINAIQANNAGISSRDGGDISVRGSRSNETVYFLDGVRVTGSQIPQCETTNTESYEKIKENSFYSTEHESVSTFALDVDKAAYSNVRRFIKNDELPPIDAVRIEEMINYFPYAYPEPKGKDILAVHTQLTACPWNDDLELLHIGVQSKKMDISTMPLSNLVFLLDVSGSMYDDNKLPLVIESMKILINQLRPDDRVAIVTYAGNASVPLNSTRVAEKDKIMTVLDQLQAGGSTAGAKGIITAYEIAVQNYIKDGNNRVILATDGDFNVGISDNKSLEKLIEENRNTGVFLSVLGYGMGNYKDDKLQILADKGNGNHAYIDDKDEAIKVLASEFGGTMYTLAKDVKFQIEFNPAVVQHYRLVGYENRLLAKEDFNNDQKDGGELGMGHQMTAIYEIIRHETLDVDILKYSPEPKTKKEGKFLNELATIKFRYKDPNGNKSKKWEQIIKNQQTNLEDVSDDVRFSLAVAHGSLILRNAETVYDKSIESVISMATQATKDDDSQHKKEFISLMELVIELKDDANEN
jgi:Ca-activated chloride channel homolog